MASDTSSKDELTHRLQMFADRYCAERQAENVEGMAKELGEMHMLIAQSNQQAIEAYQTDDEQFHIASAINIVKQEAVQKALESLHREIFSDAGAADSALVDRLITEAIGATQPQEERNDGTRTWR